MSDKIIHICGIEIGDKLPRQTPEKCPHCGGKEFEYGYGIASGGFGFYEYCVKCVKFVSLVSWENEKDLPEDHEIRGPMARLQKQCAVVVKAMAELKEAFLFKVENLRFVKWLFRVLFKVK